MPIILPPITRRQFAKRTLALGGTAMMTSRALDAADSEPAGLDQNRVALLADTHISADPDPDPVPIPILSTLGRSGLDLPSGRTSMKA